jgi:phage terminase large subunit
MELDLQATAVFDRNYQAKKRIVVNQGGTGSSKSYSLAQLFIVKAWETTGERFSIVRKSMPALKATAMHDFFSILKEKELYDEKFHNKSENVYHLHGNAIEFFGLDQPQKVRSRRRKKLWMNEGNEFTLEDWRQLTLRTDEQVFLDFNPSDQFHWIYDHVLNRADCELIVSTYLDNPFLPVEIVKEIESYRDLDENYWKIYGLGERGSSNATIYTHWELVDELPESPDDDFYGLDFGFNNQSALQHVALKDEDVYSDELLYERRLTNFELICKMKGWDQLTDDEREKWKNNGRTEAEIQKHQLVPYDKTIYADAAEPQRIEEIRQAGFDCHPADKSVKDGIDTIKRRRWYITKRSVHTQKEVKSYRWKQKDDIILDEPVKTNDHLMDATRYPVHTYKLASAQFIGFV